VERVIIFISDIHTSHMVPTPAAVLGVVIPYNSAWSLAWATSCNSARATSCNSAGAWRGMCVRLVYASRGPDARGGAGGGYTLSGCDIPACRCAITV
jgi:hypothetical protein